MTQPARHLLSLSGRECKSGDQAMLTLRQIEVIRAIMVTGTVGAAARLLNVSSPGISRLMKHAETSVGVKLFNRRCGRYTPTREANAIFNQINGVYDKVEDLQFIITRIKRGADIELKVARCRVLPMSWRRVPSPTCAALFPIC
jgi:DNA-binding transcriptional LysR family regulator